MSSKGIGRDGEISKEAREAILASRDELEALAESNTPGAPVAKALLRRI